MHTQAIIEAVIAGDATLTSSLLKEEVDPVFRGVALEQAVADNDETLVELLLARASPGIHPYGPDGILRSLRAVIRTGSVRIFQMLMDFTDICERDVHFGNVILETTYTDRMEPSSPRRTALLEYVMEQKWVMDGFSLAASVTIGDIELFHILLNRLTRNYGVRGKVAKLNLLIRALILAADFGVDRFPESSARLEVFSVLLDRASSVLDQQCRETICLAATESGSIGILTIMLPDFSRGVLSPKEASIVGECLYSSIASNRLEFVKVFLSLLRPTIAMMVMIVDMGAYTVLEYALPLIQLSKSEKHSLYRRALGHGNVACTALLVPRDLLRALPVGGRILARLADRNHCKLAKQLIRLGANLSYETRTGITLLQVAAMTGDLELVVMIIDGGVDFTKLCALKQSFISRLVNPVFHPNFAFRDNKRRQYFFNSSTRDVYWHFIYAPRICYILMTSFRRKLPFELVKLILEIRFCERLVSTFFAQGSSQYNSRLLH